jgi:nucleotide-binding universal stress UspA family protein
MKRILVASDLSARADRAVERAFEMARREAATVTLLYVLDGDLPLAAAEPLKAAACSELAAMMSRLDPEQRIAVSVRVVAGQPDRAIVDQAKAEGCDLIVLGTHRNEASPFPIVGSTMERIVGESPLPVLVAKRRVLGPYRTALVATDFSAFSRAAVQAAADMVPDGTVHVTHVYHLPFPGFLSSAESEEQIRRTHRHELERLVPAGTAATAGSEGVGPDVVGPDVVGPDVAVRERDRFELHLVEGEIRSSLRKQVSALGADLLVLGTQGRQGVAKAWMGSVAEDFLVRPPCDVLVVKRW